MKKRILALLVAIVIVTGNGVLVYAETTCGRSFIQSGENENSGYTAPEMEESDFAIGVGKSKQLTVPSLPFGTTVNPDTGETINEYIEPVVKYSISDGAIASVSADGVVTGLTAGNTTISIEYSYTKDDVYLCGAEVSFNVYVTDATLSSESYRINIKGIERTSSNTYETGQYVTINGLSEYSVVEVIPSSSNLVITQSGDKYYFNPKRTGDYSVTFIVDGKSLSCDVSVLSLAYAYNSKSVTDVGEKHWNSGSTMVALYTGETTTLKANGFPTGEKIVWTSSNKSVATVSQNGVVTAKSVGYTTISASAHGFTITYEVGVSYKTSIKAMRYAVKYYNSTYSQAKRMSKGYYDCSSYVWRAYKDAGFNIGNCKTGWAPVAASLAQWCVSNNYMVYSGTVDVDKLMPGDLIFWTGANNGRYQGIYHVDMYVGNHHSLTVAREKTFGDTITNCMVARPNSGTKVSKTMISTAKVNGKNVIRISWSGCYLATGYHIYRSTSKNGKYTKIATIKDAKLYVDANVKSGKKYYYKVRPYWNAYSKTYNGKISDSVSKKL